MTIHVIPLRDGCWCAYAFVGDQCFTEYGWRRDDAVDRLKNAVAWRAA